MGKTASLANIGSIADGSLGFRNRIINGAMVIDQRNAGAEVNPAVTGTYYLDRWIASSTVAGKYRIGQNAGAVSPPVGFVNYLGCTSLSAYTAGASEAFNIQQRIEGYNIADLAWGTASAAAVTISFWVYSSLTGVFGGSLRNSAVNRSYPFTFTINTASTWELKTITIAGDTTGTWLTNSGIGMFVAFSLGAGSTLSGTAGAWAATNYTSATGATSVVGTSGATFYITGVQLEKGSTATSFDYRPYGTELGLCQRYYQVGDIHLFAANTASGDGTVSLPVQMRASPTYTYTDSVGTADRYTDSAGSGLTLAVNANSVNTYRFRAQAILARSATWWEFNYRLSSEL